MADRDNPAEYSGRCVDTGTSRAPCQHVGARLSTPPSARDCSLPRLVSPSRPRQPQLAYARRLGVFAESCSFST
jgi:hypothetical protein